MYIEHLAIWCKDLEIMKEFYARYFNGTVNDRYYNQVKNFSSYFVSFEKGPRIELMQMPGIPENMNDVMQQFVGLIHFAVSVGSEEKVDSLTDQLRSDGYTVVSEPRRTGDGYYESVIFDPEGNRIEITA